MARSTQHFVGLSKSAKSAAIETAQAKAEEVIDAQSSHDEGIVKTRQAISAAALNSSVMEGLHGVGGKLAVRIVEAYAEAPVADRVDYSTMVVVHDPNSTKKVHRVEVSLPKRQSVDPRKWAINAAVTEFSGTEGLTPGAIKFAEGRAKRALDAGFAAFALSQGEVASEPVSA